MGVLFDHALIIRNGTGQVKLFERVHCKSREVRHPKCTQLPAGAWPQRINSVMPLLLVSPLTVTPQLAMKAHTAAQTPPAVHEMQRSHKIAAFEKLQKMQCDSIQNPAGNFNHEGC